MDVRGRVVDYRSIMEGLEVPFSRTCDRKSLRGAFAEGASVVKE